MKFDSKKFAVVKATACSALMSIVPAFAADEDAATTTSSSASPFISVVKPILTLLNGLMAPLLVIVGAVGGLYCILLGVNYAKAVEPQDREKAKSHLKNAIIGFVLIFVLILALNLLMDPLISWVNTSAGTTVIGDYDA